MLSYVFGAVTQCWKPRNMFVSLSCSRWSVCNSDSFMFAATEWGGEKGHFQHGGFLHIFNYVYVVSCWNENPPPWIFISVWAELRQSCALSLRAQPWETVIKTSPPWAVRLMKGVSCHGQRGKHVAFQIWSAISSEVWEMQGVRQGTQGTARRLSHWDGAVLPLPQYRQGLRLLLCKI